MDRNQWWVALCGTCCSSTAGRLCHTRGGCTGWPHTALPHQCMQLRRLVGGWLSLLVNQGQHEPEGRSPTPTAALLHSCRIDAPHTAKQATHRCHGAGSCKTYIGPCQKQGELGLSRKPQKGQQKPHRASRHPAAVACGIVVTRQAKVHPLGGG